MNAEGPLSYRTEAPMRWVAVDGAFDAAAIDYWSEANLRVLTQIAQFEERGVPVEQPTPQDLEIQRLHAKLDLLLSAVAELAPRFLDRPPRQPLQLSWRSLSFPADAQTPAIGSFGLVEVHLHALVLQPLRWPARMSAVSAGIAEAELLPANDAAQQALERHVFQQHRRAIAAARRG
jgi:hypothetical protein